MSQRELARHFNLSRDTVRKMLAFSTPPGYRREKAIKRPKLDGWDVGLRGTVSRHKRQYFATKVPFETLQLMGLTA
jgi:transposase